MATCSIYSEEEKLEQSQLISWYCDNNIVNYNKKDFHITNVSIQEHLNEIIKKDNPNGVTIDATFQGKVAIPLYSSTYYIEIDNLTDKEKQKLFSAVIKDRFIKLVDESKIDINQCRLDFVKWLETVNEDGVGYIKSGSISGLKPELSDTKFDIVNHSCAEKTFIGTVQNLYSFDLPSPKVLLYMYYKFDSFSIGKVDIIIT